MLGYLNIRIQDQVFDCSLIYFSREQGNTFLYYTTDQSLKLWFDLNICQYLTRHNYFCKVDLLQIMKKNPLISASVELSLYFAWHWKQTMLAWKLLFYWSWLSVEKLMGGWTVEYIGSTFYPDLTRGAHWEECGGFDTPCFCWTFTVDINILVIFARTGETGNKGKGREIGVGHGIL
jgi:hypothetical protein